MKHEKAAGMQPSAGWDQFRCGTTILDQSTPRSGLIDWGGASPVVGGSGCCRRSEIHVGSPTFRKPFASVKLCPVGWAVLSTFNQRRGTLEAFDAPERAGGGVFLGVAAMYLLIPAIAFLVVHLASSAAAMSFAPAVPPTAGPGLGPAGPLVNVSARLGR
jgi:hypothetical protein